MSFMEPSRIDYDWIKRAAKAQQVSVNEYIVLAPQNDPFYTGTPNDRALGQWFAAVWQQLGEGRTHLRRVHYYLVSLGSVTFPNGRPYENTMECWEALNVASKAARYLQLVDPAAFNDRRTPEVMLYASEAVQQEASVLVWNPTYSLGMKLPHFPDLPHYEVEGFTAVQPYHLELWCEKSTMNDVFMPLCERYGANLQTGMGEMSITATLALVHRLYQAGKPARILYVSDFDPAGQSMPVAVSRKIEYFVRTLGLDLDIRLFPVVLTLDQVQQYQLPRTPIKESEKRRDGFESRHGAGAVELDALEALYPGELERILDQYMACYYDVTLAERVREQQHVLGDYMHRVREEVMESYRHEVDVLLEEYHLMRQEFEPRMQAMSDRLRHLWQAIKDDLSQYRGLVDQYPVPQPYLGQEIGDGLYNSEWDYLSQVEVFKRFQGR